MGRAWRAAALLSVAGLLSGCGTVANLAVGARDGWKNARIYGGVRRDVQSAEDWLAHSWIPLEKMELQQDLGSAVGVGLVGLDVPFSAIGDTLTLPITIPASIWGSTRNEAAVTRKTAPQQPVVPSPQPALGSQQATTFPPEIVSPSQSPPQPISNRAPLPDGSRK